MDEPEKPRASLASRKKVARQTWFWSHLVFGVLFIAVAVATYYKTDRVVPVCIFGVAGLIALVDVAMNPCKRSKE